MAHKVKQATRHTTDEASNSYYCYWLFVGSFVCTGAVSMCALYALCPVLLFLLNLFYVWYLFGPDPSNFHADGSINNTERAIAYGLKLVGAPYSWWHGGALGEGPPAWAVDDPAPNPSLVREKGVFCAGVVNLMLRSIGRPIPKNPPYNGGTGAYGKDYKLHPFSLSAVSRDDAVFRPYANEEDQGHIAVALGGAHDKVLQSFAYNTNTIHPGVNTDYTLVQSNDGGFYKYIIKAEELWG